MTKRLERVPYLIFCNKLDDLKPIELTVDSFAKLMTFKHGSHALGWRGFEPEVSNIVTEDSNLSIRIDCRITHELKRIEKILSIQQIKKFMYKD